MNLRFFYLIGCLNLAAAFFFGFEDQFHSCALSAIIAAGCLSLYFAR